MNFKELVDKRFKEEVLPVDEFYETIQPYIDAGILREVVALDHCSILCLCEKVYVALPYNCVKYENIKRVVGMFLFSEGTLRSVVDDSRKIYYYFENFLCQERFKNLVCVLDPSPKVIEGYKSFCESLTRVNVVNPELEAEIAGKSKKR